MNDTKPTAANNKNRNESMIIIRLLAVGYILYMLYDTIRMFIAGGEEAPSLITLLVCIVVLGGGALAILIISWKQYQKNKQQIQEMVEQARAQAALEEQAALETVQETADDELEDTL